MPRIPGAGEPLLSYNLITLAFKDPASITDLVKHVNNLAYEKGIHLLQVPADLQSPTADALSKFRHSRVVTQVFVKPLSGKTFSRLGEARLYVDNIGVPGGGVNPLRGQNNVQGACDMGGLPNVYPGYQPVTSPEAQRKFEEAWGTPLSNQVGKTVTELVPGILEGKTKALYIMGEDPIMSDPDTNHIRHCLEACDFIVLQEIFPTETAPYADVLLPGVTFAEKNGTFTNTERRIQRVRKALQPLGETRDDWKIIASLAERMLAETDRAKGCPIFWLGVHFR